MLRLLARRAVSAAPRWGAAGPARWGGRAFSTPVDPRDVATELVPVATRSQISSLFADMESELEEEETVAMMKAAPTRVAVRDALGRAYGTGRRKEATARVWVFPGDGKITVNRQNMHEYFQRGSLCNQVILPFMATLTQCEFDVWCTVKGGGKSGQSGAIRHGVSRALEKYDPEYRAPLKRLGYLTRDPRMVERKKPGRKKARKLKQWVKR